MGPDGGGARGGGREGGALVMVVALPRETRERVSFSPLWGHGK